MPERFLSAMSPFSPSQKKSLATTILASAGAVLALGDLGELVAEGFEGSDR